MKFEPMRTERLLLRHWQVGDAEFAFEYRNLPEVARYQDWEMPYTLERAHKNVERLAAMEGPTPESGWSVIVCDPDDPDRVFGDLYVGFEWDGRVGYFGYTLHPDHWGKGYATEASLALVTWFFEVAGVSRIESSLHPDNPASARVLEACGMLYEGLKREGFWVGDECSSDMLYGMTKADWEAWRDRPRHRPENVRLVELTSDNRRVVTALATHKSQEQFVSPMLGNFRDALIPPTENGAPLVPWYRAIEADGDIVGFIMATEITEAQPNPYLWRLLIDRMHQRRGVATAALDLFEQRCRDNGASAIEVSWVPAPGGPEPLYRARGYEPSGLIEDGEVHAVKSLA